MADSDFIKKMQLAQPVIKTVFVDVGGVLLSSGWDKKCLMESLAHFGISDDEIIDRHCDLISVYHCGKISLDEYIKYAVFYTDRHFGCDEYKNYIFEKSQPNHDLIKYIRFLRGHFRLKIVGLCNEGREINDHRIQKFGLGEFIDIFIASSYLKIAKPDPDFYKIALDLSSTMPQEVLYIEENELMTAIASKLGITTVLHKDYHTTRKEIDKLGFYLPEETVFG